jgi:hypothetical protein
VVQHRSCYRYPRPALLGPQLIRLQHAACSAFHLLRGAARERQHQDALRVGTIEYQRGMRAARVIVLPLPTPAITSSGPGFASPMLCATAARCSALSIANGSKR